MAVDTERLDAAGAQAFKQAIMAPLDRGINRVVLDLSRVDFMDSSGLSCLLAGRKSIGSNGILALAGITPKVMQLFRITKLDRGVFPLYPDVDAAVAALVV